MPHKVKIQQKAAGKKRGSKKKSSSSGSKGKKTKKSSKRSSSGKTSDDGPTSASKKTSDELETAAPLRSDGASTGVSATTGGTSGGTSTNETTGGSGGTSGTTGGTSGGSSRGTSGGTSGSTGGETTGEGTGTSGGVAASGSTGESGVTTHTSGSAKTKGGQTATVTTSVSAPTEGPRKKRSPFGRLFSCKPKKKKTSSSKSKSNKSGKKGKKRSPRQETLFKKHSSPRNKKKSKKSSTTSSPTNKGGAFVTTTTTSSGPVNLGQATSDETGGLTPTSGTKKDSLKGTSDDTGRKTSNDQLQPGAQASPLPGEPNAVEQAAPEAHNSDPWSAPQQASGQQQAADKPAPSDRQQAPPEPNYYDNDRPPWPVLPERRHRPSTDQSDRAAAAPVDPGSGREQRLAAAAEQDHGPTQVADRGQFIGLGLDGQGGGTTGVADMDTAISHTPRKTTPGRSRRRSTSRSGTRVQIPQGLTLVTPLFIRSFQTVRIEPESDEVVITTNVVLHSSGMTFEERKAELENLIQRSEQDCGLRTSDVRKYDKVAEAEMGPSAKDFPNEKSLTIDRDTIIDASKGNLWEQGRHFYSAERKTKFNDYQCILTNGSPPFAMRSVNRGSHGNYAALVHSLQCYRAPSDRQQLPEQQSESQQQVLIEKQLRSSHKLKQAEGGLRMRKANRKSQAVEVAKEKPA
ncbi:hypothetical protein COOONC_15525 [Cooperia oncophora]